MRVAAPAALMQFLLVGLSFAALVHAFVTSDFSVRLVAEDSNSMMPTLYKVTATWGNHEGSMLLWVLILTLFGASGGGLRARPAAGAEGAGAGRAGDDRRGVLRLHPVHLEPVRAAGAGGRSTART